MMTFTVYPRTAKLSLVQDVKICLGWHGKADEIHVSMQELTADVEEAARVTGLPIVPDHHIFAPEIWIGKE